MTAREVALLVARDVFAPQHGNAERGAQEALDYRLGKSTLDARDRAFATLLAFGAIKMRRAVDWYLQPYVGERRAELPAVIAEVLRLAVYELRFASGTPHAAVSQWVNLAKHYGHRGTAGLVNAVLRGFLRDDPRSPVREDFSNDDDYLGTLYSYPTWLVRQWRETFGSEQLEQILEGANAPAQSAVVCNRARTTRENVAQWFRQRGAQAELSSLAEDAVLVSDGSLARGGEREADGAWWVQSESSATVADILNAQQGETIADVCSGRGSKALQTAARLNGDGELIAIEQDERKLRALLARAQQAQLGLATVTGDATQPILDRRFDRVLIDAPCSGTGVVGRHPEARWRKQNTDGERLASVQRAMLDALANNVYEGGALVYAVCSTDPRETAVLINEFLRDHPFERGLIPERFSQLQTPAGDVLIPPGICGREGFYIARLERTP